MYVQMARNFLTGMNDMLIDSVRTHVMKSAGVIIEINQPTPTMDFRVFGYKKTRWGRFGRRYLDQEFFKWLDKLGPGVDTAQSGYMFRSEDDHNHGNCVVGLSFTRFGRNNQPEITVQSRTAYLFPTSILELTLAGMIADYYLEKYRTRPRLRWMVAQLQFSTLWGFPWLSGNWDKVSDLFDDGLVLHKNLVNHTRHLRLYDEQMSGERISPYKRQRRMLQRTSEVKEGNYEPFIPTTWPLERLGSPIDSAVLLPYGNQEDGFHPGDEDDDSEDEAT